MRPGARTQRRASRLLVAVAAACIVAGCSLVSPAATGPDIQAQREALIASFVDALEGRDAAAIAGMVDPMVDATADIAALMDAHGGLPFEEVKVGWGPLEIGEQARNATIQATTADGTPHVVKLTVVWDGTRAQLALGSAPGIDPGADTASPSADLEAVAVRQAAEGAVRALYGTVQPPADYTGTGLSPAEDAGLRAVVGERLRRYFAPELVARYEPMLADAIAAISAGSWDSDTAISIDWEGMTVGGPRADLDFVEHVTLTRHSLSVVPSAWRVEGTWTWTMTLAMDAGVWRVAAFELQCRNGCP